MILANCRNKMTADDFAFIVRVLDNATGQRPSLEKLLLDEECRDSLLEHERVVGAILESPDHLPISPGMLFYVLCRRVLRETPAGDRETTDYLASMLEKFLQSRALHAPEEMQDRDFRYVSDVLAALVEATPAQAFVLRTHVANYSLFLSGVFHDHVEKKTRRGGPSLRFYEDVGRSNFAVASKDRQARSLGLEGIFANLAESFHEVRIALNDLADRLLHLGDAHGPGPHGSGQLLGAG
jgi:hypothetical protein